MTAFRNLGLAFVASQLLFLVVLFVGSCRDEVHRDPKPDYSDRF